MQQPPNRIAELRTAKGLSQQALAELVGTTNQQIGHLEAGRRRLTDAWMRRLAPALDVAPPELIADGADALSLDVELLATAIESALLLTKHAQLTFREVAEQAAGAYTKALRRRHSGVTVQPD